MNDRAEDRLGATGGDLAGAKVTVVGLGRFGGGLGVTRWLCKQGARVTVTDIAEASQLAESLRALKGFDVTLHLGGHDRRDFVEADLLVVNPAVPKDSPYLAAARQAGVPRTSEINLFLQRCDATVVGVTGSVGKSTTTAMIGAILSQRRKTHVGGNIGISLLEQLPQIEPHDVVVLELSSFQLEDLPLVGISPHVAVVTNLLANHLDRHGTMEAYGEAKKNIFRFQGPDDVLILNAADPQLAGWAREAPGRVEKFDPVAEPFELAVPGLHNQANAQAAWTAARQLAIDRATAAQALRNFRALPHRLQFVAEHDGVRYYDDSKSTTPAGAIAALQAFEPRKVVLIAGGYDKGIAFDQLGTVIRRRARALVAFGATRRKIINAVLTAAAESAGPSCMEAPGLSEAVTLASQLARPGDVVVLSPACASYDQFANYEKRGQAFVESVRRLGGQDG